MSLTVVVTDRAGLPVVGAAVSATPSIPAYRLKANLHLPVGVDLADQLQGSTVVPGLFSQALAQLTIPFDLVADDIFRIDSTVALRLLAGCRLIAEFEGAGFTRPFQAIRPATWPRKTPYYAYLRLEDCVGGGLEGLTITGPEPWPNPDPEEMAVANAIEIAGASRFVKVLAVTVVGVHGDLLTIAEHGGWHPVGVLVEDFIGSGAGRQLCAVVGGQAQMVDGVWTPALTVRRFTLERSRRSGLDVEPSNAAGASGVVLEDGSLLDSSLYCVAGGNETPHRDVSLRRVKLRGRLGPAKYGPPDTAPPGTHTGLTFEDVTYEPMPGLGGTLNIFGTTGIRMTRCRMNMRGQGSVATQGLIEDSVFTSSTPVSPALCARGTWEIRNSPGVQPCV